MNRRKFGKNRQRDPREPELASKAILVDYRLDDISIENLDTFYRRIGYPERLETGLLVHVGGVVEGDETIYLSVWRSEAEALESWQAKSADIEAVLADAPPEARVTRRANDVHHFFLGDDLLEFREGLTVGDPDCVGFVIDLPEVDLGTYDHICKQMNFPGDWPDGLLMHVAGRVDDFLRVVSVWRSGGQSRDYFENQLIPASVEVVREHGVFPEIRPREMRIHLIAFNKELYE